MLKGKSKSMFLSIIVITIILVAVVSMVFVKRQTAEENNNYISNTNMDNSNNIQENTIAYNVVEVSEEEKTEIENYINELCNNYFGCGRVPLFDRIENADKNWIYAHIRADESNYITREDIENNLLKLFGENYDINLSRDSEYIENNMFKFDENVGKYEQLPAGKDMNLYYIVSSINKANQEYIVNVLESVIVSDYNMEYGENEGQYSLIETFKDYDNTKSLIENGKEVFHLESSKIYPVLDGKSILKFDMLKGEVLKRKNEFLAYNITIKRVENGNFVVQKIESVDVNN